VQRQDSTSWTDNLPVLLGTTLAVLGFTLVLLHGLSSWGRFELDQGQPDLPPPVAIERPVLPVPEPIALTVPEPALDAIDTAPEPAPREVPAPPPVSPSNRMLIPRIAVDSAIVDVALKNGEWPVPRFIIGHLAESAHPGEVGNAVFAGHLLSIASGNVFARLKELEVGDEMAFFADDADRVFRVIEARVVRNTDVSVLAERPGQALVTLITCEGTWLQREQDYSHRRIVVAEAVSR
jgi:LPXTG-site transpeptidase (sortase) family protein